MEGETEGDEDPEYEFYDSAGDFAYEVNIDTAVLVAKPSPYKSSSINHGDPSSVPNKPGLFFPYFHGMIAPDNANLRDLCRDLFFRNIGSEKEDVFECWKRFRGNLNTLSSSPEGMVIHHVLMGCKMALDAQARLFLVFADKAYRGYCLLGDQFSVVIAGTVHKVLSPEDLRKELSTVSTRKSVAKELAAMLEKCLDVKGEKIKAKEKDVLSCSSLSDLLAAIDLSADGTPSEEEISSLLSRLQISADFKKQNPENITEAVAELVRHNVDSGYKLDPSIPYYIPTKGWNGIDSIPWAILARFGSTSFSFRNPKGLEFRIPAESSSSDSMMEMEAGGKEKKLFVYEKPVRQCVADWDEVVKTGSVRMDPGERAAGQRALALTGDHKRRVWEALKDGARTGAFAGPSKNKRKFADVGEDADVDFSAAFSL